MKRYKTSWKKQHVVYGVTLPVWEGVEFSFEGPAGLGLRRVQDGRGRAWTNHQCSKYSGVYISSRNHLSPPPSIYRNT